MESKKIIFDKIEKMYNLVDKDGKQKNKAFFSHLIRSYTPFQSVDVAVNNPDPKDKKVNLRCVFTKQPLVSIEGLKKGSDSDSFERNLGEFVKSFDKEIGCFTSTMPMKQLLKGKILALQGRNTKTYMSQESYATFLSWIMSKFISGDKDIKFLINSLANKKFHPSITVKPKTRKMHSTGNGKKTTLGDIGGLEALRDKLKSEEEG